MRISICIEVEEMATQSEIVVRINAVFDSLKNTPTGEASPELVAAVEQLETLVTPTFPV